MKNPDIYQKFINKIIYVKNNMWIKNNFLSD